MKKLLLAACLLILPFVFLQADDEGESMPSGPELLAMVQAQLPPMPLELTGFVRTRQGKVQKDRRLVSVLRFGDVVPSASYSLFDNFGELETRVEVTWPANKPTFAQWDAEGMKLPEPAPEDEVLETGLTWSDLSLDFLWWPDAKVVGEDLVKSRSAIVLEVPAPAEREDVAQIKLWVDKRAQFIVRAELYDAQGELLREIEVDSIKKVREDMWMVKDLIIYDRVNKRRIGIRFEEVIELDLRVPPTPICDLLSPAPEAQP